MTKSVIAQTASVANGKPQPKRDLPQHDEAAYSAASITHSANEADLLGLAAPQPKRRTASRALLG